MEDDKMPSSVTHSFFCEDVYEKCPSNVKKKLTEGYEYFRVFGQGPDPYFFYDFHLSPKARKVEKINKAMQHSKVNLHFVKLINYINEKNYYSNEQVMAYLYGQICHFGLDSTAHPYIIYMTGLYDEKNKETYKYNGLHEEMEYYIDCYLIFQRKKMFPKNYKTFKELFKIGKFNEELKDTIDTVVKEVYGFDMVSDIYYKAIMDMKKFYHVFNYDPYGIKKVVYKGMDLVCQNRLVKKEELSFHVNPLEKTYYLNNEKNVWNHPCDINEVYDLSFTELYVKALNKVVHIISQVDEMLKMGKIDNKKIEELFGNLDYGTGKDCDLNLQSKYFRF